MKGRLCIVLLLFSVLLFALPGCREQGQNLKDVTSFVVTDSDSDLEYLEAYPSLNYVDMQNFRDYQAIMEYISKHPNVQVVYGVEIGENIYPNDVEQLTLQQNVGSFEQLLENLRYLPKVTALSFPNTDLTLEQIAALKEEYSRLDISYTVSVNGTILDPDTAELDLSWLVPEDVESILNNVRIYRRFYHVKREDLQVYRSGKTGSQSDLADQI